MEAAPHREAASHHHTPLDRLGELLQWRLLPMTVMTIRQILDSWYSTRESEQQIRFRMR